jgi:hypothetical protein
VAGKRHSFAYWFAVIMAAACVGIVILHHTSLPWNFEIAGVSLSWLTGGAAIFAILVHEFLDSVAGRHRRTPRRESRVERNEKPVVNQRA